MAARGATVDHAAAATATSTRQARAASLEDIVEPEDEVLAVTAAERGFDSQEDAVGGAEPESDAVVGFQIAQVQILDPGRHLASVIEERAVHSREDLPSVFRLEEQRVLVAEAQAVEAAKVVGSAKRPLVIERHLRPVVGVG